MIKVDLKLARWCLIGLGLAGIVMGLAYFVSEILVFVQHTYRPIHQHAYSFIIGTSPILGAVAMFIGARALKVKADRQQE